MARIFLCHASEDKAQVREVYHRLKALGFAPWLDEVDILPGQDWGYEIKQALETSDFVLVFLSTRSVEKIGYVQCEFRRALYHAEERPEGFIHTIPVKLDDCAVPSRFRRHQWAKLYEDGAFERIVRALHYGLQQRRQPLPEPFTHDPSSARPETSPQSILQSPPMTSHSEVPATQVTTVPEDDKPFDAVLQREEAATPPVSKKDQPEGHHHTTSDARETTRLSPRQKRRLLLIGGVPLLWIGLLAIPSRWYYWETDCAQYLKNVGNYLEVSLFSEAAREYLQVYDELLPYICKWKVSRKLVEEARSLYNEGNSNTEAQKIAAQKLHDAFQVIVNQSK